MRLPGRRSRPKYPPQTNQRGPELQPEQQRDRQIDPFKDEPQTPSDEQNEDQSYLPIGPADLPTGPTDLPIGPADRVTDFRPRNVLREGPHTTGAVGPAAGTPVDNRVPRKTYGNIQQASATVQLNLSAEGNTVSANPLRGGGSMSAVSTHSKTIADKPLAIANRGDTDWLPANNPLRAQ